MKQLVSMIWHDKKDVLLAMLAGTISGLTAVALFAQSGFLISKAALMPPFYIILILTAFLKLFGVSKSASKYAERYISHRVTFRFLSNIRMLFFRRLLPRAHVLNTYKSGDLLNRITTDVEVLQNFFLRVLYPPFIALFVFLTTILFTLFFSPWLSLLLMIGLIFTSTIVPTILYKIRVIESSEEKRELANQMTEFFYGYRDLQLHNQLKMRESDLLSTSTDYSEAKRKELDRQQSAHIWNQLVALMTTFFVVMLGAYLVSTAKLDGLYLAMLVLVALTVFESTVPLAMVPTYIRHSKVAIDRLEEVAPAEQVKSGDVQLENVAPTIECRAVTYYYPDSMRASLYDIHFNIKAKEKIAIVGPSGSGKSTLLQLMMKEFYPTSGELLIGGHSTPSIADASLHEQIGVMLQHNHFFSGTIRENLLLAKPATTDEEMKDALKKAYLSKALDDEVHEKAGNLSGGEKQRLAFARLLLKDSTIWLLDEPFSNIDAQTERRLFEVLLEYAHERTVILITHRITNLEKMDKIYCMHNGTIVESGTEQQLLENKQLYYEMYRKLGSGESA